MRPPPTDMAAFCRFPSRSQPEKRRKMIFFMHSATRTGRFFHRQIPARFAILNIRPPWKRHRRASPLVSIQVGKGLRTAKLTARRPSSHNLKGKLPETGPRPETGIVRQAAEAGLIK